MQKQNLRRVSVIQAIIQVLMLIGNKNGNWFEQQKGQNIANNFKE